MSSYSDNQVIEDMIVDVSISLEEADKAGKTLHACQESLQKTLPKLQRLIMEMDDQSMAQDYAKQVSQLMLKSLIQQRKMQLESLLKEQEDND